MSSLIPFTHNNLTLLIRDGATVAAERDIVKEVQIAYEWDFPIETAIDIGAHVGAWTRYAKWRHPKAAIAAIEVDPQNYEILQLNLEGMPDVMTFNARAGYLSGPHVIGRHMVNSGSTSVHHAGEEFTANKLYELPDREWVHAPAAISLEYIMNVTGMVERVDVLKLDCEGSEVEILNHITPQALSRIQRIVGEIHTVPDVFGEDTDDRLLVAGYQVVYAAHPGDPNLFYFHAWRN